MYGPNSKPALPPGAEPMLPGLIHPCGWTARDCRAEPRAFFRRSSSLQTDAAAQVHQAGRCLCAPPGCSAAAAAGSRRGWGGTHALAAFCSIRTWRWLSFDIDTSFSVVISSGSRSLSVSVRGSAILPHHASAAGRQSRGQLAATQRRGVAKAGSAADAGRECCWPRGRHSPPREEVHTCFGFSRAADSSHLGCAAGTRGPAHSGWLCPVGLRSAFTAAAEQRKRSQN